MKQTPLIITAMICAALCFFWQQQNTTHAQQEAATSNAPAIYGTLVITENTIVFFEAEKKTTFQAPAQGAPSLRRRQTNHPSGYQLLFDPQRSHLAATLNILSEGGWEVVTQTTDGEALRLLLKRAR